MGRRELASKNPMFSNEVYDFLKFVALIVLPAAGALYFGVAEIWGLPNAQEVVGTLVVVDAFLGVLLKRSNTVYEAGKPDPESIEAKYDGALVVDTHDPMKDTYSWEFYENPVHLSERDELHFKVKREEPSGPLV